MGDSAYAVFVGRCEGKRPLERLWHQWEDNIEVDLKVVVWGFMDWRSGSG
jgi:hypothetical protein